jgi:hypothetical protein
MNRETYNFNCRIENLDAVYLAPYESRNTFLLKWACIPQPKFFISNFIPCSLLSFLSLQNPKLLVTTNHHHPHPNYPGS